MISHVSYQILISLNSSKIHVKAHGKSSSWISSYFLPNNIPPTATTTASIPNVRSTHLPTKPPNNPLNPPQNASLPLPVLDLHILLRDRQNHPPTPPAGVLNFSPLTRNGWRVLDLVLTLLMLMVMVLVR